MTSVSITISVEEDNYVYLRGMMSEQNINRSEAFNRLILQSKAYQQIIDEQELTDLRKVKKAPK